MTSAVKLAEIYLGNPGAIETLRATPNGLRISPQIPDYIAAGSYFGLCWVASLGLAIASGRRGVAWLVAGVPLIVALYLTGSRSVIAAALAGLVMLVLMLIRQRAAASRSLVAFGIIAVVVMVIGYPWWTGRDLSGVMARQSLHVRVELAKTGLKVIETRPLFGVGIDRFHLLAGSLASPDLNALFPARKNPHNDFLRFASELGLVGLGLFLWILAATGRVIWRALQTSRDPRLAGLVGGIIVFLVTSMVSNPLMVREVSYVFWIALGLAVGRSTGTESGAVARGLSRWRWPVGILVGGLLVFSIPLRARQELAETNLSRVSHGLFEWGHDPDGTRSRWSRPEFTLFVDGRAALVEIPLSGIPLSSAVVRQVEIRVDGRLVNRVAVGPEWQRVRTPLPGGPRTESRRLDFVVSPPWTPAEEMEGSEDRRVLGVKVGELKVFMVGGDKPRRTSSQCGRGYPPIQPLLALLQAPPRPRQQPLQPRQIGIAPPLHVTPLDQHPSYARQCRQLAFERRPEQALLRVIRNACDRIDRMRDERPRQQRAGRVLQPGPLQISLAIEHGANALASHGGAAGMAHNRVSGIPASRPEELSAIREIDVLVEDEERRIEPAERIEQGTLHDHRAATRAEHLARFGKVLGSLPVATLEGAAGKQVSIAGAVDAPGVVGEHDPRCREPEIGPRLERTRQAVQPVGRRDRVVVQENKKAPARLTRPRIVASRKSQVAAGIMHTDSGKVLPDIGRRTVIGRIVHDDHFKCRRSALCRERIETGLQPLAPVVIQHDDRDFGRAHPRSSSA